MLPEITGVLMIVIMKTMIMFILRTIFVMLSSRQSHCLR